MHKQLRKALWVLATAAIVASLVLTGCRASAVSPQSAPESAGSDTLVTAATSVTGVPQNNPPGEGIRVHGHWTIEVTNPDGTLAERREFDNAFQGGNAGSLTLALLLGRQSSVGAWRVDLGVTDQDLYPFPFIQPGSGYPMPGQLIENNAPGLPSEEVVYFPTLTIQPVALSGANAYKLVLTGSATAGQDGSINTVSTWVSRLPPSSPPSSIYQGLNMLTYAQINPVNLTAGQQVAVTVAIGFSSAP